MSEPNTYQETSEIMRPIAMKQHVDETIGRARELLLEGDVEGALLEIWTGIPRFQRLGGIEVLDEIERQEREAQRRTG